MHLRDHLCWIFVTLLIASPANVCSDEHWPQFRGPGGAGHSTNPHIPLTWEPGKNVAWTTEIGGSGWSSPVVWENRIFITTAIPDKKEAEAPRGMRAESNKYAIPDITYDWRVLCLSLIDGKILWNKSVHVGKPIKGKHTKNTYATETPATDGQRLYVYFSQVGLFAFDMDGAILWKQTPGVFETYLEYGSSSSPITDGERVYLQCDNQERSFVAAYDAATGKELWKHERDDITSWSTPFLWKNNIRTELVTASPKRSRGYDPASGTLLWELGGMSDYAVPTPIADDRYCYISSGFLINPRNRPIFAVKPGAEGDITLRNNEDTNSSVAWRNKLGGPYVPSPVLHKGRLYVVHDRPLFDALDTQTGRPIYPRQRLPHGGNFTASPLVYRDKILCLAEEGQAYLIDAADEFKVHALNPALDDDGLYLATPALAQDSLLIRGAKKLHCIRAAKPAP
jgi:outer membrane protein assembly factor BamB